MGNNLNIAYIGPDKGGMPVDARAVRFRWLETADPAVVEESDGSVQFV